MIRANLPAMPPPKEIKRGFVVRVNTERVTLPNGTLMEIDIVKHPGAAAIVPFISDTDVLLIRQYRHATRERSSRCPPARSIRAKRRTRRPRELQEEVGRRAARIEALGWIWTTPGFTDERIHLYAGFDLEPVVAARRRRDHRAISDFARRSTGADLARRAHRCKERADVDPRRAAARKAEVKLGVAFGWYAHPWETLLELVETAEALGYAAAFVDGDVSMLGGRRGRLPRRLDADDRIARANPADPDRLDAAGPPLERRAPRASDRQRRADRARPPAIPDLDWRPPADERFGLAVAEPRANG